MTWMAMKQTMVLMLMGVVILAPAKPLDAGESEWSIDPNAFLCTWLVSEPYANDAGWRQIAYANNGRGEAVVVRAAGQARYLRISSLKPDGENQVGRQMGISEVQVFARER